MKRVDAWLQQADSFLANEHITKMSLESLEPHYLRSQVSSFSLYYLFLNVVIKIKFKHIQMSYKQQLTVNMQTA